MLNKTLRDMKTLSQQAIAQSIRENFTAYPENYPFQEATGGVYATEESISNLVNWVENEYENSEMEDKGNIDDWYKIAIDAFVSYFEIQDGDYDETGEAYQHIVDTLESYRV